MKRCQHGIYLPDGMELSPGCQSCYPHGRPDEVKTPKFNRRSALELTSTGKLPKCPKCGIPVSVALGGCPECGIAFENDDEQKLRANNKQAGVCPECGSGTHFETTNKKEWECVDCGAVYPASARRHE